MKRNLKVEVYYSFEEENKAERKRRSQMSLELFEKTGEKSCLRIRV